jgi:hypothetical protein
MRSERYRIGSLFIACIMVFTGCIQVGPDFIRLEPQVMPRWMEADDAQERISAADYRM